MDESLINAAKAGDRNRLYELLMQIPDQRLINAAQLGDVDLLYEKLRRIPNQRLINSAQIGDVHLLYELLRQDAFIFEVYDHIPFIDTPLHVAVSAGQTHFVVEMANLKPSFTKKLNQDGFSPLHLAAANGQLKIVRKLLKVDQNLCFLKGRDDKIPLHCAVENERIGVLDLLISSCPNSVTELTVGGDTVLHLAVKNRKLEAFKKLVEWLPSLKMTDILGWKDQEDNTILHLAISLRQLKMIEILLLGHPSKSIRKAVVNATSVRDMGGLTPLDLFREIAPSQAYNDEHDLQLLQKIGGIIDSADRPKTRIYTLTSTFFCLLRRLVKQFKVKEDTPSDVKNALLVILVLIVTATYQSSITPFNQLLKDTVSQFESYNSNNTTNTDTDTDTDSANPNTNPNSNSKSSLLLPEISILVAKAANYAAFILSFVLIYNLTDGFPLGVPVRMALIFMLITYLSSVWVTGPGIDELGLTILVISFIIVVILPKFCKAGQRIISLIC